MNVKINKCAASLSILSELQMEDDAVFNSTQRREYPAPPPLPTPGNTEPSELYQTYMYYITAGVPNSVLAPQPIQQMTNIMQLVPPDTEDSSKIIQIMRANLEEEVKRDYYFSLKKSIVNYILMDPSERQRLSISNVPKSFPWRVIRAPVPWGTSCREVHMWLRQHLFTVNQILVLLQDIWLNSFSSLRFVRLEDLFATNLPLLPTEYLEFIQRQCQTTREELIQKWLPHCASIFESFKDLWLPLITKSEQVAPVGVQEFFNCVASLMSLQLRSLVIESLQDLLVFFAIHEEGNDFGEEFDEMKYVKSQVLLVKLQVNEPDIEFSPSLQECWEVIHGGFMEIIKSAEKLQRVECNLFPNIENLYLRSVGPDESLVTHLINKAKNVFDKNTVGPKTYLNVYQKYRNLLDNTAKQEISAFLKEKHSLEAFTKKIESINQLRKKIASMHITVPLSMFCLYTGKLNEDLCNRAERLKDKIITFQVEENRELNKGICQKYEDITEKVRGTPETVEELVTLNQYIKKTSEVTVDALIDEVNEATFRLSFLLDHATLPPDDLRVNSHVFQWPSQILIELEDSKIHLATIRIQAEDHLQTRIVCFDQRLQEVDREIQTFKKKEVINMEEMKSNAGKLCQITANLEAAVTELENINKEQSLLEMEQTQFPMLQMLIADKQPYEQLWTTALNFQSMSEVWMNGPFRQLNAEKISEEVDIMWRTMHKLTKTLSNLPGPCLVAKSFKSKIDQFKQHLPILTTICNPGMKDRHWEKISSTAGFEVKPDENSSLMNMLDLGLSKFSNKLEEIGASASKEYSLEKSLETMKNEWINLQFAFTPYKDRGTNIISAVDDIQLLLDDHIIKTQTIRSSPFIKPIETECKQWEEKLLSMQDIIDSMLKCQATWLYLEPIFSSEDIIAQMPEEGRKFAIVDGYWKNIIGEAVKDTRVLVATGQPNMLERLQESNMFLDDIQKGLNTYLEKKRLYFPRFFFLSNDELLEILSQTKDPLCVQPHLKKCFEGIAKLEFTEDMEITGMISSEKETVPFTEKIYPAEAKAYLEKCNEQIADIVQLVRGKLSGGARMTLGALTVIDVHARDVVAKLSDDKICSLNDFAWISQLRYFWEDGEVMLRMITTCLKYGYEYLGNSPRLVITPLTDRCYRTLMGALKLNLGGAPEGPAGTGKTETTKDLAKALAKQVEVLSVVAQQVLCIQQAIAKNMKTFVFEGTELLLNPTCSVFITMNPGYAGRAELPDNLKHHYDYGMRAVKSVLTAAGNLKLKYPEENESVLLLRALMDVNMAKFLAQDVPLFQGIISDLFPGVVLPKPDYDLFLKALNDNIAKLNLQPVPWFIGKIIQVYEMMLVRHGFMIVGDPLGGKTSAYQVLAAALGDLYKSNLMEEFAVNYCIINPKAITLGQLYGCFDPVSHEWSDGVLATSFRDQAISTSENRQWIIFDGPIDAVWIENMNTVLDDNKKLCLMSGEIIQMSPKMSLIFEPADLEQASPATVSRCGMIYMEPQQLGWAPLKDSYINTLPESLSAEHKELIVDLFDWLVQPCLDFIERECHFVVQTSPIHLAYSLMKLYTCLLAVWTIGGTITGDSRKKFDIFYRALIMGMADEHPRPKSIKLKKTDIFPERGTVYDYFFKKDGQGQWNLWIDSFTNQDNIIPAEAKVSDLIIPTNETARQLFFLHTYLAHEIPMLFLGPTGTGKSIINKSFLVKLPKEKYTPNCINFSARTSANQTQDIIMAKLDRRRKGVFGPPVGKKCVVYVDDLNMPAKEIYGAQPPIELLRQWIDHHHWYDKKDTSRLNIVDVLFMSAMGPPGGGMNDITGRFIRHLNVISIDCFDDETLTKIFSSITDWHFSKGFDASFYRLSKIMVQATLAVYKDAIQNFLPTPSKSHYIFNLRDFARVIGGVLLAPHTHMQDGDKLIRLWIHEVYRVFYDRLIDNEDKEIFFSIVKERTSNFFKQSVEKLLSHLTPDGKVVDESIRSLFFGDYATPESGNKVYDEITDLNALQEVMEFYLTEHNNCSKAPMSLVMFKFAIEHISRICRVLKQDNGHLLLVGIGGSGRQSTTKLATFISDYVLFQIELTKNYSKSDWRDDLKRVMLKSGIEGKNLVFLFTDSQIKDEGMLEDINMLLNTGDVPNIFAADERADIIEKVQGIARMEGKKIDATPLSMYNFFIDRVKANLHIVLAMSPIGDAFRNNLRMFPSLINCCTIDWFHTWPNDALEMVAHKFLEDVEMDSEVRLKVVEMCKIFQTSVREMSERYFSRLRRHNYVTPTSYLELILTFKTLLNAKRNEVNTAMNRYIVGLQKLEFTASQISVMQQELTALQPELIQTSAETDMMMVKIEGETIEVDAKKELVSADEKVANEAAAAAQAIKDECEEDLAEAMPALKAALSALDTLKPADITVVKSMQNPPGKMIEDFWGPSKKLLGDLKFLESLKAYDKDNIPAPYIKRIREKFIDNPDFQPSVIKNVSSACEGLCKWVRAMEVYERVARVVAPKKERLNLAEEELGVQMGMLAVKRAELKKVEDRLQSLNDDLAAMICKKKELEDKIESCSQKLIRAEKLIGGLGGEKDRWTESARQLEIRYTNLTGDILLSSGTVSYLGAFTVDYRMECQKQWHILCHEKKVPRSEVFTLSNTLGNQVAIRAWQIAGLPVDSFSTDNGIIVSNSRRWPLMIDPQGQANKWIKNMEKANKLAVIKLSDPNYVRVLENSIQFGTPVLLENVGEELDPVLEPVLLKQTFKQQGVEYMKIGENIVEYSKDFLFYMTTGLRNPHYLPEVAVKVCLLNFMITPQGLQDQLLGLVAAKEKPELEEKKNQLILESAANSKQQNEIEDKILLVLSSSEGNILEDETAIQILSSSKILSEEITEKQKIASFTEREIDDTRMGYRPVAEHSSILFFCISELANVEPMYQYSLTWFINLYLFSIAESVKSDNVSERINNIVEHFTLSIYNNVCRSLFEKDKLLFSLLLTVGIMQGKNRIDDQVWRFFLTGGIGLNNPYPNPAPDWMSDKSWSSIVGASKLPNLKGFSEHVQDSISEWKKLYDSGRPHKDQLPDKWNELVGLDRMVVIRCFRPDKLVPAVQDFIVDNMGPAYIEPPTFDLPGSYKDSNCCSPLIFVLSPGSDPTAGLLKFADDLEMGGSKIQTISLGQGQGPIAAKMIDKANKEGTWVVLQNCHLATSWMPTLERICEETITPENTHPKFRLWLTSYPSDKFPVSILQNGLKMTNEPPKGIRANLLRSYLSHPISDPAFFESSMKQVVWQKLIFGLTFFHALVQERRNFGPLGWNIPYEFNESDLRISMRQIQNFLDEYDEVPLEALTYLTGECNYGGRVTDDKDRRLLLSLLSIFYSWELIEQECYHLCEGVLYYVPSHGPYQTYVNYIRSLPICADPCVFGLHSNADITKDIQETNQLLDGVLLTLPRQAGGGAKSPQELVEELAEDILSKLPEDFDIQMVNDKYPVMYEESMNTVLRQEVIRFNRLTHVLRVSLANIRKALKGQIVMSAELENVFNNMLVGKVPAMWAAKSYPSLKPLGSYVTDLLARLKFLQVTKEKSHMDKKPEDGAYIRGLFMEGARWDKENMVIGESLAKILFDSLPIIKLKPGEMAKFKHENIYVCPVYKTTARRGTLSTTGHSTNYVLSIELPSDKPQRHWINRGVACLCQLDD
ncbi:Dynein heavy chain 3, axonemal Axonemal beta dynein heavy chain 3 [Channa argus]|uniref:Dynein heavy chain 3, axonemal Axonemal beta dynein heavy chain 3 n=1 Tax=Channa argus TaxID=215402 RepID=A0A6G1QZ33_CHAAH|nr:Dynein heavy chain 3, axonemal Axonemal beta dynein heavy chain 3 [Channa argus]